MNYVRKNNEKEKKKIWNNEGRNNWKVQICRRETRKYLNIKKNIKNSANVGKCLEWSRTSLMRTKKLHVTLCDSVQIFVWFCVTLLNSVWLSITLCDFLWLLLTLCDSKWHIFFDTLFESVWLFVTLLASLCLCMNLCALFSSVGLCMTLCDTVWLCLNLYNIEWLWFILFLAPIYHTWLWFDLFWKWMILIAFV